MKKSSILTLTSVTERARRLRAQYHLQAQGLRSRIEIRINRIPMSLRKVKMEDLLLKYAEKEQQRTATSARPPPVPAKDAPTRNTQKPAQTHRLPRVQSHQRSVAPCSPSWPLLKMFDSDLGGDKENEVEDVQNMKKKTRGPHAADGAHIRPGQVLSPTSSNTRLNNGRPASPTKSQIGRPGSPLKAIGSRSAAATSMLSSFVEKAKSTRGGTRKATTTSNTGASQPAAPTPSASTTKTRRGAAPAASKAPTSRPATRTGRRISANSETSEGSTNTVVRKGTASKAAAPTTKKRTLGAFSKGTASGDAKKTTAAKSTAASTTRTGRVLRNRG